MIPPAGKLVDALLAAIRDPAVAVLPQRLGGINQITDNTDLLEELDHCRELQAFYTSEGESKSILKIVYENLDTKPPGY